MTAVLEKVTGSAKSLLRRAPGLEGAVGELGRAEYHGVFEDYMVLNGLTPDRQIFIIDGRPMKTDMSMEEFKQFMTGAIISSLDEEKTQLEEDQRGETVEGIQLVPLKEILGVEAVEEAAENAVVVERKLDDSLHLLTGRLRVEKLKREGRDIVEVEIRRELTVEKRREFEQRDKEMKKEGNRLREIIPKPLGIGFFYLFSDWLVLHIGHVDMDLRDYGYLHEPTMGTHIVGNMQALPERIDLGGRKVRFCTFDPYDFREEADGGHLTVTFLTHETLMQIAGYIQQAVRVGSVLKLTQENKRLKVQLGSAESEIAIKNQIIGDQKARIIPLEEEVGHAAQFSVSSAVMVIGLSCLFSTIVGGAFGLLLAAFLPVTTTCPEPVYNVTSGIQTGCLRQVITGNPVGQFLPLFLAIAGAVFGLVLSLRHFRGRK